MGKWGSRSVAALLVAFAAAFGVSAQEPTRQQPVFRAEAPGIEVDVRVFDRDGRFVDTLGIEDFEVLEDGVPQTVRALTLVGAAAPVIAAPPASGPPTPGAAATAALATQRQTWVFVFDLNHLTPGAGFERAKSAVETYLAEQFKDDDIGGVVAGSRMVGNRLTSVREDLVAAARSVTPLAEHRSRLLELTREWPRLRDESEALLIADGNRDALQRAVVRACTDDPTACRVAQPDSQILEKSQRLQREAERASLDTLTALNALASGLARVPGPKTIVFLSDGFVTAQTETTLQSVVGQTARAGARIYAIDVRGLNRGPAAGIGDQISPDDSVGGPARFDMGEDGPNSLAVDTGGFVIRNENNLSRALATISSDANRYYVIGYQPIDTNFNGKYRVIDVRVKRDGVDVRARRGYLALEPARMLTFQPIRRDGTAPPAAPEGRTAQPVLDTAPPIPTTATAKGAATVAPPSAAGERAGAATAAARIRPDAAAKAMVLAGDDVARTDALASEGWEAFQRGDIEAAVKPLTDAAAQPDVQPWVLYVLGLSHTALYQPREAIVAWERVRRAAPTFAPVYLDLAATYGELADLTNALAVLREAVTRWPKDIDVHNAVGVILVRRGALDDAIKAFEEAAGIAPDDPVAHLNLGRTYEMRYSRNRRYVSAQRRWVAPDGDRQKAIEHFQRYVDLEGPYADQATQAIARLKWGGG